MDSLYLLSLLAAIVFAAIHFLVPHLRFLEGIPRSRWLSFAGGVAVAYVFMHLLPELAEHQEALTEETSFELLVYALSLSGLALFYGLERMVQSSKQGRERAEDHVFWIHAVSFAIYNILIGYFLLHREDPSGVSLAIYVVAMGLHFVTNDFGMHDDHRELYDRRGRYLLAAAVVMGWVLGVVLEIPEIYLLGTFSFLAGGVVLNVLKEELPEERQSSFGAFATGVAGYGMLLLAL
ncbi:hypothetical protein [Tateyamaria sp. syn59]|uniref:hypothetical protein n=1 Tax=Tateyamaria sp. syn59 TaxID=2576942 RepID=UPI0011BFC115|nr:hypothetical protein [Tateyamaria sp. syn59]